MYFICETAVLLMLTLIRVFWDYNRARFLGKKSRIIPGDATVGTKKIKIISADTVSVGLSYRAFFKYAII